MNQGIDRDEVREDAAGQSSSTAPADQAKGSGGGGGYGDMQNQENHQGQQSGGLPGYGSNPEQSRGEAFDEAQGGGRGSDSVSGGPDDGGDDAIGRDLRAHQDRGQSAAEEEAEGHPS
ncbi:MAG: hypothetical protein ACK4K7_07370 [Allosphingosinicella sp.]|uniref:hypothetical protein n=1 Tax=Allosphingosinicella sp. TaxID=2823234 RepID=UPI00393E2F76